MFWCFNDYMDELYKEFILELNRRPLHKKVLSDFDIKQRAINKSCGDDIVIQIKFDQSGRIAEIGYQGQGCAISQAAVSLLLDDVLGKNINEVIKYDDKKMIEIFSTDVIYSRRKCLLIGLNALLPAIQSYKNKNLISYE